MRIYEKTYKSILCYDVIKREKDSRKQVFVTLVSSNVRWIMKQKKQYGLIVGLLILIGLATFILTKEQVSNHRQKTTEVSQASDKQQEQIQVSATPKEDSVNCATDDYWKAVLQEIITKDASHLEHKEEIPLFSMENTIEKEGITYDFGEVKISKELPKECVLALDYGEQKIDKNGTITNGFSYVIFPVSIKNKNKQETTVGLNSIYIYCFGEDAKEKEGIEIAGMKTKRNERLKSFFIFDLEKGERLQTDLVYIVPDEFLTKKCGLVFSIDVTGVTPQCVADTCYIKIPIGRGEN